MFVLFSDIHWGEDGDSDLHIQRTSEYIDWMIRKAPKDKEFKFIFLGDWFNDRSSISSKTQHYSYRKLYELSKVAPVYMIVGNHDCYFKDTSRINSISVFGEIEERGKKFALIGWNGLEEFNKQEKKYDAIFGHFEFVGAQLRGSVTTRGTDPSSILKNTPIAFSGHYHIRKQYFYKQGTIQVVGSPFQITWGDEGDERGFILFDPKDCTWEPVNNTVSPKHVILRLSDIKKKAVNINIVQNNIPKLIIDEPCNHDIIVKLIDTINTRNPFEPCEIEYSVSRTFETFVENNAAAAESMNVKKYVNNHVNRAFDQQWPEVTDLDKDKLINLSLSVIGEDDAND
jgi:DNA repair exonuclease SbcCD nuclease subunit